MAELEFEKNGQLTFKSRQYVEKKINGILEYLTNPSTRQCGKQDITDMVNAYHEWKTVLEYDEYLKQEASKGDYER